MMGAEHHTSGAEWDGHLLLLHSSESERRSRLTAWVRRGLDRDEKIIYTEESVRPQDSFLAILDTRGVDVAAATADGQLVVLSLAEFYPPEGYHRIVDQALTEGFRGVRMSAQADDALTMLAPDAYHQVERHTDQLCQTQPLSALCQYNRSTIAGDRLGDIVAVHATGVRQLRFSTGKDRHGLTLHGEIDADNADVFAATLDAVTRSAHRVVWLDLAAVEYVDAAACRLLATMGRRFRATGKHLLLVAPPASVERTMRLLGIDEFTSVELVGGNP